MRPGRILLTMALALLPALSCRAAELVFAVMSSSAMPMTDIRDGELTGGLLKDFGDALARELHMAPRYVLLPRKRVEDALAQDRVDLLCDLRPEWVDGKQWLWSDPVFSNKLIVATRADTAPLTRLARLGNKRTGTVLGYRYPRVEAVLGNRFLRDEAATDDINLSKLLRGRFAYALTNSLHYNFQRMVNPERRRLNADTFTVFDYDSACAIRQDGKLSLDQLNRIIALLRRRGEMEAALDRYRPLR